jgi:uncharacterized protein (UPF0332 family)
LSKSETKASEKSLKLAKEWFRRAKDNNILGYKDLAMLASYISMLHAARAILLKDGVKDLDSIEYLKKRYPELREHAASMDQYGKLASAIQQDPDILIERSDAKGAMDSANELIKFVERILSKRLVQA